VGRKCYAPRIFFRRAEGNSANSDVIKGGDNMEGGESIPSSFSSVKLKEMRLLFPFCMGARRLNLFIISSINYLNDMKLFNYLQLVM
jgi:hypothetical protein